MGIQQSKALQGDGVTAVVSRRHRRNSADAKQTSLVVWRGAAVCCNVARRAPLLLHVVRCCHGGGMGAPTEPATTMVPLMLDVCGESVLLIEKCIIS